MLWRLAQRFWDSLPIGVRQRVCGWVFPGHQYTVEMIREGSSFIIDPLAECAHCELPLPKEQYDKVVTQMQTAELDEDEVW